jgi:hypothetical protein
MFFVHFILHAGMAARTILELSSPWRSSVLPSYSELSIPFSLGAQYTRNFRNSVFPSIRSSVLHVEAQYSLFSRSSVLLSLSELSTPFFLGAQYSIASSNSHSELSTPITLPIRSSVLHFHIIRSSVLLLCSSLHIILSICLESQQGIGSGNLSQFLACRCNWCVLSVIVSLVSELVSSSEQPFHNPSHVSFCFQACIKAGAD